MAMLIQEEKHHEEAKDHLLAVLYAAIQSLHQGNTNEADEIRYQLDQFLHQEVSHDSKSFQLGMVEGLVSVLNLVLDFHPKDDLFSHLSIEERNVMVCLADYPRITLRELIQSLPMHDRPLIQHALQRLKAKEIIHVWEVGAYQWYQLTSLGENYRKKQKN